MDIAIGPPVDGTGLSSPVVDSIDGLAVESEIDEVDDEPDAELSALGCTQAANGKTSAIITRLSGTILSDFKVPPREQLSSPRERCPGEASSQRLARWNGKRISEFVVEPGR
jgi:hypothetical protein